VLLMLLAIVQLKAALAWLVPSPALTVGWNKGATAHCTRTGQSVPGSFSLAAGKPRCPRGSSAVLMASDARMLIGHCRYATQDIPADNINNHPHPADGGWIVHNGQIRNYGQLVDAFDLSPVSACDSEVLGLLIEQGTGNVFDRCRDAVDMVGDGEEEGTLFACQQPLVLLGLWPRPDRLVAIRRGNPLHWSETAEGYYLASLADGLPGTVRALRDNTGSLFTRKEVHHAAV
jgi:glucosamine 6-phosphate synthetase-like amidotransferase/phosphosugar isomerase protein